MKIENRATTRVAPTFGWVTTRVTPAFGRATTRVAPTFILFLLFLYPALLFALPEGGVVTAGDVAINQSNGTTLEIAQSTNRAIINWNQFNIAANEQVHFAQPDSSSVTLNRITGGDPSAILGSLTANGSIFLVNPHGVFFGPTATVDVGSLIATTIDIPDGDFLAGNHYFTETGTGTGSIINQGNIKVSDGGFVFFIAPSGIINQSGIIEAKSLVDEGGIIRLLAETILHSGTSDVSARDAVGNGGEILLLGQEVAFTGTLFARGGTERGNGGTVEVSGSERLEFDGFVSASAVNGIAGNLLLDPKNIIIEDMETGSISPNPPNLPFGTNPTTDTIIDAERITEITKNGTDVTLQANNNITVNEAIITNAPVLNGVDGVGGALILQAGRSILINADIISDGGRITLTANYSDPTIMPPIGSNRDVEPAEITMAPGTKLDAGGGQIIITLSTGSGIGKEQSGAITLANLTTASHIRITNNGPTAGSDILQRSDSLITASSIAFDISGTGSVGTVVAPIRIAVSNVDARSQSGNIFLTSTQDVTVGGAFLSKDVPPVGGAFLPNIPAGINASGQVNLTVVGSENKLTNTNNSVIAGSAITLQADQMVLEGGTINAAGSVTLRPGTAGRAINLGNVTDPSGILSLSDAELDTITTGILQIGDSAVGAILISAPIDTKNTTSMTLINGSSISQTAPITEEALHVESAGTVILTNPNNFVGTLSGNITNSSNNRIIIDDITAGRLLADSSQTLINEQGQLSSLRLDVLTEAFVALPASPCKGEGQLIQEMTLEGGC